MWWGSVVRIATVRCVCEPDFGHETRWVSQSCYCSHCCHFWNDRGRRGLRLPRTIEAYYRNSLAMKERWNYQVASVAKRYHCLCCYVQGMEKYNQTAEADTGGKTLGCKACHEVQSQNAGLKMTRFHVKIQDIKSMSMQSITHEGEDLDVGGGGHHGKEVEVDRVVDIRLLVRHPDTDLAHRLVHLEDHERYNDCCYNCCRCIVVQQKDRCQDLDGSAVVCPCLAIPLSLEPWNWSCVFLRVEIEGTDKFLQTSTAGVE